MACVDLWVEQEVKGISNDVTAGVFLNVCVCVCVFFLSSLTFNTSLLNAEKEELGTFICLQGYLVQFHTQEELCFLLHILPQPAGAHRVDWVPSMPLNGCVSVSTCAQLCKCPDLCRKTFSATCIQSVTPVRAMIIIQGYILF